ncbi:MAG: NPCBM/NEW2 domain-containing protein [Pirellulales bacterium]
MSFPFRLHTHVALLTGLCLVTGGGARGGWGAEPPPAPATHDPQLLELAGRREVAALRRLEPPATLILEMGGVEVPRAAETLIEWGLPPEPRTGPYVVGQRGTRLAVTDWRVAGDQITLETSWSEPVVSERRALAAVVLAAPTDPAAGERQLHDWLAGRNQRDQLFLRGGDTLAGQILGWAAGTTTPEASPPENGNRKLRVELARGEVTVPEEGLAAVVWRTPPTTVVSAAAPAWRFGLQDGSLLSVARWEQTGAQVRLELLERVTLTAPADDLWSQLVYVQTSAPQVMWLSDLEPTGYKHVPFLTRTWPLGRDENVLGTSLRSGGRRWLKGLGMHSTSRSAYRLGGNFQSFHAELALDDEAGSGGSVEFRVYIARDDGQWQSAYASPVVRGGDPPLPLNLDVTGVQQLALIVDAADQGDQRDYANWLNARLLRTTAPAGAPATESRPATRTER